MVKTSADALLAVINDILDFSKIEAGKLDLDPRRFRPAREPRRDASKPLACGRHEKGLELACRHRARRARSRSIGDPGRLRQILVNLVGNAIKFTERGEVVVAGRAGRLVRRTRSACTSSSRDTGIGIPAEKQAIDLRALRPGRRLDDADATAAPAWAWRSPPSWSR